MKHLIGRVTIPTDVDVVEETLEILEKWGADALRDCDGTEFPEALQKSKAKIYATYYTTRKDNTWAKAHPDEVQQCYICSSFHTATQEALHIPLLEGFSKRLLQVNDTDDIKRWWEVIDRTTGEVILPAYWSYEEKEASVILKNVKAYHEYSVSFLAYLIWDPVHMYNALVNDWEDFEPQITFDLRQPKTKAHSLQRLRFFLEENPHVDVVRFTTFFHQFTLLFDELERQKYVDWYGYSASVSPYILSQFEEEISYPFRPEYIIDQGYYNNQYRVPTKEYLDFMAFQRKEVAKLAKEMVKICHAYGKEAMMFLGDHFIGMEPFLEEFQTIGLDAVVGSVGNASTLRLISDIKGVNYTEGRLLPYFFPDTFYEGGNPLQIAQDNWLAARRGILRKPLHRIGYGGYLKLALQFPAFVDYVSQITEEFRQIHLHLCPQITPLPMPYTVAKVAILNCWGVQRAWGCHMVHHALYQKENYSYAGVLEILAGGPYEVCFISFLDILHAKNPLGFLKGFDAIINVGGADTAHSGGTYWKNPAILSAIRAYVAKGGSFIGIGEPSAHLYQGRFFQLASLLGVEKENGFTLSYDKYNWEEKEHFITAHLEQLDDIDFGESCNFIYALPDADVLVERNREVHLASNLYFSGRSVYFGGLPYSGENALLFHRALLWCTKQEEILNQWFAENPHVAVHYYPSIQKYCVANNSNQKQQSLIYTKKTSFSLSLNGGELLWFEVA